MSSTSSGSTLSCLAAMPLSLSAIRSAARWAATAVGGEAAGIRAGGDRPLIFRRVHLQHHVDVVRREAEPFRDDLRQHGLMPLPLHGDVGRHRDRAERMMLTVTIDTAPFLGPALSRASGVSSVDR